MAQKIVAGNWKMNKSLHEAESLFSQILESQDLFPADVQVIVAPPAIYLCNFAKQARKAPQVSVSSQNCAYEQSGAFTGEISSEMLRSIGVQYSIIGHSERRSLFGESNGVLGKKVDAALEYSLLPIFCVGESLEEREGGNHFAVVEAQLESGVFHLAEDQFKKVILAYEPVWAIGTGKTASAGEAQEIHAHIRKLVAGKYGSEIAADTSILYGGSCNPDNAAELFAGADVDGGLIGGAALKVNSFVEIVKAAGQ
jgi:triosephosphate isomerase